MTDAKKPDEEEMGLTGEDILSDVEREKQRIIKLAHDAQEKNLDIQTIVENQRRKKNVVETENYVFAKDIPSAEPAAEYQQPGEKMESFGAGMLDYGPGMLVRDKAGQVGSIVRFYMIKETRLVEKRVAGISGPKIPTRPRIIVKYPDGTEKDFDIEEIEGPLYLSNQQIKLTDEEKLQYPISYEFKGHKYLLGELVSYGYRKGILAAIFPEQSKVGIKGKESENPGLPTTNYYMVNMADVDYIEFEENKAIKRNPDGTFYRPSKDRPNDEITEI